MISQSSQACIIVLNYILLLSISITWWYYFKRQEIDPERHCRHHNINWSCLSKLLCVIGSCKTGIENLYPTYRILLLWKQGKTAVTLTWIWNQHDYSQCKFQAFSMTINKWRCRLSFRSPSIMTLKACKCEIYSVGTLRQGKPTIQLWNLSSLALNRNFTPAELVESVCKSWKMCNVICQSCCMTW